MSKQRRKVGLKRWLKRWMIWGYLRGVGWSLRLRRVNWHVMESMKELGKPFVMVLWHNGILTCYYFVKDMELVALVSESADGDDIAWVSKRFDLDNVRGSSSLGGAGGVRAALRVLEGGGRMYVTPDGPRGPRYHFKAGAVSLSRLGGAPLVPVGLGLSRRWVLSSWDGMRVPRLFAEAWAVVGSPLYFSGDQNQGKKRPDRQTETEAEMCVRASKALQQVFLRAEQLASAGKSGDAAGVPAEKPPAMP